MGRSLERVKKNFFKPVTKLYHTTDQRKIECTTQRDMATACIIENKKTLFANDRHTVDAEISR